jgi:hypothetical protein
LIDDPSRTQQIYYFALSAKLLEIIFAQIQQIIWLERRENYDKWSSSIVDYFGQPNYFERFIVSTKHCGHLLIISNYFGSVSLIVEGFEGHTKMIKSKDQFHNL